MVRVAPASASAALAGLAGRYIGPQRPNFVTLDAAVRTEGLYRGAHADEGGLCSDRWVVAVAGRGPLPGSAFAAVAQGDDATCVPVLSGPDTSEAMADDAWGAVA